MNKEYLERMMKFGHLKNEVLGLVSEYRSRHFDLRYDPTLDCIVYNERNLIEFESGMFAGIKIKDDSEITKDLSSRLVNLGFCIVN